MSFYDPDMKKKQSKWDEPTRSVSAKIPLSVYRQLRDSAAGHAEGLAGWFRDAIREKLERD